MLDLSNLAAAVRHEGGVSRRLFLAYGAALAALPGLAAQVGAPGKAAGRRRVAFPDDPFRNRQRGYVRCTLTPAAWRSDFVVVEDVLRPGGRARIRASFVV